MGRTLSKMDERNEIMKELEQDQLKQIEAGGIGLGVGLLIAAGVVFIIGVIDGFFRPLKCNT